LYCIVLYCIILYPKKTAKFRNFSKFPPIFSHQSSKKSYCIVLYCIVSYCIQKKRPNFATIPNFRPFFLTNRPKNHIVLYCIALYHIASKKNGQISHLFHFFSKKSYCIVQKIILHRPKNHIASSKKSYCIVQKIILHRPIFFSPPSHINLTPKKNKKNVQKIILYCIVLHYTIESSISTIDVFWIEQILTAEQNRSFFSIFSIFSLHNIIE